MMLEVAGHDADGAGDGAFAGGSMGLEHGTVEAQHGSAAVGLWIHAAFNSAKSILREQRAKLTMRIRSQFALQHHENANREAFTGFQNDISDKTVANHDFHTALE